MSELWRPDPVVVDPDLVTAHIHKQIPLPAETARTVWVMNRATMMAAQALKNTSDYTAYDHALAWVEHRNV
jgi:hypothetical protein